MSRTSGRAVRRGHPDFAIAFASIDPSRGAEGVREATRLVAAGACAG